MPVNHTRIVHALPESTPFVGPEALERRSGVPIALRLGANESPFGASPSTVAAMREQAGRPQLYGDPEGFALRERLSSIHGMPIDSIVLGAGIDELLGQCVRILVEPGEAVVTTLGSYPTFEYGASGCGARIVRVPYFQESVDLKGLAEAAWTHSAKVVYLANPDNPSGSWHASEEIHGFQEALPPDCALLLDEAYGEFAPKLPAMDCTDLRIVRMRTFSKVYGLAGLRIAYAVSHPSHCAALNKIRFHFAVNSVAQAGALAALQDSDFVEQVLEQTNRGRIEMSEQFLALGFRPLPSYTNFVTVDMGGRELSENVLALLLRRGVFIRKPGHPPLDGCIRVTIGPPDQRRAFFDAFRSVLNELGQPT